MKGVVNAGLWVWLGGSLALPDEGRGQRWIMGAAWREPRPTR
jgi:hypothetical protein